MLLCSPDWSFTGPEQARQADFGGRWQGMVGEQTSQPVSGAEEVGPQVARRHAWVGALALVRCQQWHFLTMAIHKQASQQRCSVPGGMKNRPWVGFYSKGGGDVWDTHALNMTQTHFLINALIKISFCLILFLLSHTHTQTHTPFHTRQKKATPIWLLSLMGKGTIGVSSRVRWLCRRLVCLSAVMGSWHLGVRANFCPFSSTMVRVEVKGFSSSARTSFSLRWD